MLLIKRMYFVAFHSSSDLLIAIDVLILTLMTKPIVDYGISKNGLPFTSKMRIVDYANSSQDLIWQSRMCTQCSKCVPMRFFKSAHYNIWQSMTDYKCRLLRWGIPSSVSCLLKTSGKALTTRKRIFLHALKAVTQSIIQSRSTILVCEFTIVNQPVDSVLLSSWLTTGMARHLAHQLPAYRALDISKNSLLVLLIRLSRPTIRQLMQRWMIILSPSLLDRASTSTPRTR